MDDLIRSTLSDLDDSIETEVTSSSCPPTLSHAEFLERIRLSGRPALDEEATSIKQLLRQLARSLGTPDTASCDQSLDLEELHNELARYMSEQKSAVQSPSLRANGSSSDLMDEISRIVTETCPPSEGDDIVKAALEMLRDLDL